MMWIKRIVSFFLQIVFGAIINQVDNKFFSMLRVKYYRKVFEKIGSGVFLGIRADIKGERSIIIGDRINIMNDCKIYAHDGGKITIGCDFSVNNNVAIDAAPYSQIVIGDNVLIGTNSVLRASNHQYNLTDIPINRQGHKRNFIIIGNDVWIGANVTITAGVTINSHAIVGAGAVVTKDVGEFDVVGGVPARVLFNRQRQNGLSGHV